MRAFRAAKFEGKPCERCEKLATLVSLDVQVPARKQTNLHPASPAGWVPMLALCESCWTAMHGETSVCFHPDE